jgi:hypothetical protein
VCPTGLAQLILFTDLISWNLAELVSSSVDFFFFMYKTISSVRIVLLLLLRSGCLLFLFLV